MRLHARIGERRVEVLPLHGANRTRDVAVTGVHEVLQSRGKLEQSRLARGNGLAALKTASSWRSVSAIGGMRRIPRWASGIRSNAGAGNVTPQTGHRPDRYSPIGEVSMRSFAGDEPRTRR
jgi:hypothetical protein